MVLVLNEVYNLSTHFSKSCQEPLLSQSQIFFNWSLKYQLLQLGSILYPLPTYAKHILGQNKHKVNNYCNF